MQNLARDVSKDERMPEVGAAIRLFMALALLCTLIVRAEAPSSATTEVAISSIEIVGATLISINSNNEVVSKHRHSTSLTAASSAAIGSFSELMQLKELVLRIVATRCQLSSQIEIACSDPELLYLDSVFCLRN